MCGTTQRGYHRAAITHCNDPYFVLPLNNNLGKFRETHFLYMDIWEFNYGECALFLLGNPCISSVRFFLNLMCTTQFTTNKKITTHKNVSTQTITCHVFTSTFIITYLI